jgi:hypothetical protein
MHWKPTGLAARLEFHAIELVLGSGLQVLPNGKALGDEELCSPVAGAVQEHVHAGTPPLIGMPRGGANGSRPFGIGIA